MEELHTRVLDWYAREARDLPWRRPEASAWSVLVSEFMLQQTPVVRVLPVHAAWLERWPTPSAFADAPVSEVLRAWGRLGYPRRALRLHAAAREIADHHDDQVPAEYDDLVALPGIGDYTAAAVAVFAHGRRHAVLDTNVRRVLGRVLDGVEHPAASIRVAERRRALELLPADDADAATWSVAVMELGALVCTARSPGCEACPVAASCAWLAAGRPAHDGPPRRGQAWDGTDRQCRGRVMSALRDADASVAVDELADRWPDRDQLTRCLASLVADGLAVQVAPERYALP